MEKQTIKNNDQTIHLRHLNNIDEFLEYAEKIETGSHQKKIHCASTDNNFEFSGSSSLREAIDLCRYGWEEGTHRVLKLLGKVSVDGIVGQMRRPEMYFDTAGDEPDIARFLAGEPENMINTVMKQSERGPIVELIVNVSYAARVPKREIERRGVAVVIIAEALARNGHSVQVTAAQSVTNKSKLYHDDPKETVVEEYIPIQKAGQNANIDTLSFCLIHPSFLRRLIFALEENESHQLRQTMGFQSRGGYGKPQPLTTPQRPDSIVIDYEEGMLKHDNQIIPFVQQKIDQFTTNAV